jgi:hypothetical protein
VVDARSEVIGEKRSGSYRRLRLYIINSYLHVRWIITYVNEQSFTLYDQEV